VTGSDAWESRAACRDVPPELVGMWFPAGPGEDVGGANSAGGDNHGRQAKAVCATCPVWRECLEGAVERREEHGIWGGAGGDLLRALRRAWLDGEERWEAVLVEHRAVLDRINDPPPPVSMRARRGRAPVVNRNGPGATHGLRITYNRGCRCAPCKLAAVDGGFGKDVA
jgi:hypothetical protein